MTESRITRRKQNNSSSPCKALVATDESYELLWGWEEAWHIRMCSRTNKVAISLESLELEIFTNHYSGGDVRRMNTCVQFKLTFPASKSQVELTSQCNMKGRSTSKLPTMSSHHSYSYTRRIKVGLSTLRFPTLHYIGPSSSVPADRTNK